MFNDIKGVLLKKQRELRAKSMAHKVVPDLANLIRQEITSSNYKATDRLNNVGSRNIISNADLSTNQQTQVLHPIKIKPARKSSSNNLLSNSARRRNGLQLSIQNLSDRFGKNRSGHFVGEIEPSPSVKKRKSLKNPLTPSKSKKPK